MSPQISCCQRKVFETVSWPRDIRTRGRGQRLADGTWSKVAINLEDMLVTLNSATGGALSEPLASVNHQSASSGSFEFTHSTRVNSRKAEERRTTAPPGGAHSTGTFRGSSRCPALPEADQQTVRFPSRSNISTSHRAHFQTFQRRK
ncbi:unnamed protein product [Pleuronectes platessa]|uniref:Uncharacterized protein n=1 Tax=Pleuronectes platessa TaxID=8262 RepID=A0A9N7Z822_PLEPL|nr:unnamed protein product [Pleuronectes platessa]